MAAVEIGLLPADAVYSDRDLLCWFPRASHTRTEARHRFWRETNEATWNVDWTRIRVVARHIAPDTFLHPAEGRYIQCASTAVGATPVWRCETVGRDGRPMPETNLSGICR